MGRSNRDTRISIALCYPAITPFVLHLFVPSVDGEQDDRIGPVRIRGRVDVRFDVRIDRKLHRYTSRQTT